MLSHGSVMPAQLSFGGEWTRYADADQFPRMRFAGDRDVVTVAYLAQVGVVLDFREGRNVPLLFWDPLLP